MDQERIKHLEMIQLVISRMGANSFSLKTWTVTLLAGIFALAAKDSDSRFVLVAYLPAIAFWQLDGYFLAQERRYRQLYDAVRKSEGDVPIFSMDTRQFASLAPVTAALLSQTLIAFYGCVVVVVALVALVLR